ncbi:MAG: bifunctional UDP-N-acetylmuramoyl-tripeptide:D-alanyl-D-alanine ligase/alanine racemase [Chitinophagales bacterium]|nr:bifunctional UDP-N-acetylmuramoyl-tripeptide:D-alanyl-D-alanine ligase/alanine racemase [Chitinophagales bacterium]MDW8273752.1 bifunctional UDP-N-acetylmuramoyl-tripeptide:D-alanyl-D-alanine ligase/alanine racemase [Chitinophagales bacterium]
MLAVSQLATVCKGKFVQRGPEDFVIRHLCTDSRKLLSAADTLFFAIPGAKLDGHQYIDELYAKGVRAFVVSKKIPIEKYPEAFILQVKDSVEALQKLAGHHRQQFGYPVIGITGSNGKTIVKEWLYQLLHYDYHIIRSPKSYNSQIGVPLSLWQMNDTHQLAIIEAGISEPAEMEKLEKIIRPTIGIFTNIGDAHSENFLNQKHKTKEKLKLFTHCDVLIYCKDHAEINTAIAEVNALDNRLKTFTWSLHSDADLKVASVLHNNGHTYISCFYNNRNFDFEIPFSDKASVENAIHCAALMLYLGIDYATISERMKKLTRISMRLEMKEGINNCQLVNDSYNSDLGSLKIAIDFLNQQNHLSRHTLILSDILQTGEGEIELYQKVAEIVHNTKIMRFIGIGPALTRQRKSFERNNGVECSFYPDTETFLRSFDISSFHNEMILLKGARKFRFEIISKLLEKKAHETTFEINLSAIAHNLKTYQNLLHKDVKIMCMVKAFAYGSGIYEIANLLQFCRADYLAVAYTDEGVELRKKGITVPIMVMNPEQRSFEAMILHQLEPDIYSMRIMNAFLEVLHLMPSQNGNPFPIHIELETGMHRLGFEAHELDELIDKIKSNSRIKVASIFSHLAASEDPKKDAFTATQIDKFDQMSQRLIEGLGYKPLRHILNSSGISRHPQAQYDMVRLGIGLYGIDPQPNIQKKLMPVGTLKTIISQIKKLKPGDPVGYGLSYIAEKEMTMATVAIGYADGLNRSLGNGNYSMLVRGKLAPTIGRICMDMAMLDISSIPEAEEGDEVIVFGAQHDLLNMAKAAGTIPYEILTGISQRVKRVYFQE